MGEVRERELVRGSDVPNEREIRITGQFEMFGKPAGTFIQEESATLDRPSINRGLSRNILTD